MNQDEIDKWCQTQDIVIDWLGMGKSVKKAPKRVVCPKCKKRFHPFTRECHDEGCFHLYLPKHKKKQYGPRKKK